MEICLERKTLHMLCFNHINNFYAYSNHKSIYISSFWVYVSHKTWAMSNLPHHGFPQSCLSHPFSCSSRLQDLSLEFASAVIRRCFMLHHGNTKHVTYLPKNISTEELITSHLRNGLNPTNKAGYHTIWVCYPSI